MFKPSLIGAMAMALGIVFSSVAVAGKVTIKIQSVLPTKADEIVMVKDFAANVALLTNNEVQIEVLPDGAIVASSDPPLDQSHHGGVNHRSHAQCLRTHFGVFDRRQ